MLEPLTFVGSIPSPRFRFVLSLMLLPTRPPSRVPRGMSPIGNSSPLLHACFGLLEPILFRAVRSDEITS